MEQKVSSSSQQRVFPIPRWEFIALAAARMAVNPRAVDTMSPARQKIGASLNVESRNHRQNVITACFVDLALALLTYGPISNFRST